MNDVMISRWVAVVLGLVTALSSLGCAAGPPVKEMRAASECYVWTQEGIMGEMSAKVTDRATLYGLIGEPVAVWRDEHRFAIEGLMGDVEGRYESSRVIIDGLMGDLEVHLASPNARIEGLMSDVTMTSNSRCEERQLAIGAGLIAVSIVVAAQQQQAH